MFALNLWLNWPLFLRGESPYRDSIEAGYVGMARFITEHPGPWGWNPLQYCGLPVQFMYLPGLHYATALLVWLAGVPVDYAWRVLTAIATCAAPVALFALVLFFTRSRGWAFGAAVAWSLFSPLYGMVYQIDKDRGGITHLPWRVHVLVKYGEGPHNAGLALIPIALVALWRWSTTGRRALLAATAVLLALVALTNWVAALALGICCALMLLAALASPDATAFSIRRALAAAGLAYLLACFWLTPTFISTIAFNWPADAFNYQLGHTQRILLAVLIGGVLVIRVVLWRLRLPFYVTFATLGFFAFAWIVVNFYSRGIDTIPESRRYALEFEMFTVLAFLEWARLTVASGDRVRQFCVAAAAGVLLINESGQAFRYLTRGWERWRPVRMEESIEGKLATWLNDQKPTGRVLASGGLRFRLNSWFDIPQVGGAFESGLRNRTPVHALYKLRTSPDPHVEVLQNLGVEYLVIHGPGSREHYRDYKFPRKFEGVLETAYRIEDDVIYRVPQPAESLQTRWLDPGRLELKGSVLRGSRPIVRVSWDEGWRATQDGRTIPLTAAPDGFIALQAAPAADTSILLEYRGTTEQRITLSVSALALLFTIALGVPVRKLALKPRGG